MLWFFRKFARDRSLSGNRESGVGSRESGVGSREGRSLFLNADELEGRSLGWGNGELGGRSLFLNADELEGRSLFIAFNTKLSLAVSVLVLPSLVSRLLWLFAEL